MPCKLRLSSECTIKKVFFSMVFHPHFCPNPSFLDSSILMFTWTPSFPQLTSRGILISVARSPPQILSYLVLGTFSVLSLIRRSEISVSGLDLLPYLKQESIIRDLSNKLRREEESVSPDSDITSSCPFATKYSQSVKHMPSATL